MQFMQIFLLFVKKADSLQNTKDNCLSLCISYSFELICDSMNDFKCILCFREITKVYERFLVTSNKKTAFDVKVSLANLDFAVYTVSKCICRHCLGILKKRQNLKQNLKDLEECMRREYAASVEKAGFVSRKCLHTRPAAGNCFQKTGYPAVRIFDQFSRNSPFNSSKNIRYLFTKSQAIVNIALV